jgi:hypothetical protein
LYFSFPIAQKDLSKGYGSRSLATEVGVTTTLIDKKIFRNGYRSWSRERQEVLFLTQNDPCECLFFHRHPSVLSVLISVLECSGGFSLVISGSCKGYYHFWGLYYHFWGLYYHFWGLYYHFWGLLFTAVLITFYIVRGDSICKA